MHLSVRLARNSRCVQARDPSPGDHGEAALVGGGLLVLVVGGTGAATTGSAAAIVAAMIAGIVALTVARITAVTTNRRQAEQLDHEDQRLADQLAHDRELADVAELREVLDEAAVMTWNTMNKLTDAMQAADEWYEERLAGKDEAHRARVKDLRHEVFETIWPMEGMLGRLAIRLGTDHPVGVAFFQFNRASKAAARAVPFASKPERPGIEGWREEHGPAISASREEFVLGARQLVGSRLPHDG